jgi:histidine ammonia-lyase
MRTGHLYFKHKHQDITNTGQFMKTDHQIVLDGENLSLENLVVAARNPDFRVSLSDEAKGRIGQSRAWVEQVQKSGEPVVYGINTGFGSKANVSIEKNQLRELQRNLIMSHSAGTGNPFSIETIRAAMIMRANTFAKGFSGIRLEVVETLINMINRGVTPWVPEQGSVGASGDLAPLSHIALVLSRGVDRDYEEHSGKAYFYDRKSREWQLHSGLKAMELAKIPRVILEAKEGLALNNGTQISAALLATALYDAYQLVKNADIAMAMTLEALEGISAAFRPEIHELRPHPGQVKTAGNIRKLTAGSKFLDRQPQKVQDSYSLRCHPQVMAGVRDALDYISKILSIEMNSTNDNPIIFPESEDINKAISGGNFHAQPIAFASDLLAMVLCELGSISERRIFKMSDKNLNYGLPSFLIENSGLESGLMLAQYTAAALVSENKSLAHPASIDSIPTCENQEDHVSMAPIAARKARMILENVKKIVAIEYLFAAQALELRFKKIDSSGKDLLKSGLAGKGTAIAYKKIREVIPFINIDRPVYPHLETAKDLIENNIILAEVEKAIGKLD